MPEVSLAELSLPLILTAAGTGPMPVSAIPGLIDDALADPQAGNLYMRLFYLLGMLGQHDSALGMQARALETQRLYRIVDPATPAIRLLAFMGPGDATDNTPIEYVVENSDIRLDLVYLVPGQPLPEILPQHDVALVALRESEVNRSLLAQLETLLAAWPRPVLNPPQAVRSCVRDTAYQRLRDIPGLLIPETGRLGRGQVREARLPATLRPVDTQRGEGLAKIETAGELDAYLEAHGEAEFFVADYVEYRGADGFYRKSRVALIDGKPFLCHVAVSAHWMVHYKSAGMELSAEKRADEAALMEGFEEGFALRHGGALRAIADRLGLDYVVLDCAEAPDGRLICFEADTCGWIHGTDPVDVFPYKPPVMQKAFDAFRAMLVRRMSRVK